MRLLCIIRNGMNLGSETAFLSTIVNAVTSRIALRDVGKSSENMSSIYIILQLCKIKGSSVDYMKGFTDLKEQRQLHY